jgi:hypothetical protein
MVRALSIRSGAIHLVETLHSVGSSTCRAKTARQHATAAGDTAARH